MEELTISGLIRLLEKLKEQHGDLPVYVYAEGEADTLTSNQVVYFETVTPPDERRIAILAS